MYGDLCDNCLLADVEISHTIDGMNICYDCAEEEEDFGDEWEGYEDDDWDDAFNAYQR